MQNLLTIEELSLRLRKSVKSIRNDRSRNPASLPPAVRFPGSRLVLFLESDVEAHILKFREAPIDAEPPKRPAYKPRSDNRSKSKRRPRAKIGRPTNKSKISLK